MFRQQKMITLKLGQRPSIGSMVREQCLTCSYLYDEEDDDSEPVEHVVNCGSRKSAPKFVPIADLGEGDDGVGHRSANVGSHNDRNGHGYRQNYFKRES